MKVDLLHCRCAVYMVCLVGDGNGNAGGEGLGRKELTVSIWYHPFFKFMSLHKDWWTIYTQPLLLPDLLA